MMQCYPSHHLVLEEKYLHHFTLVCKYIILYMHAKKTGYNNSSLLIYMHTVCHLPFSLKVVGKVGTNTRMVKAGPALMVATHGKCILIQYTM